MGCLLLSGLHVKMCMFCKKGNVNFFFFYFIDTFSQLEAKSLRRDFSAQRMRPQTYTWHPLFAPTVGSAVRNIRDLNSVMEDMRINQDAITHFLHRV